MIKPKDTIYKLHRIIDLGDNRENFIRLDKNERTVPFTEADIENMFSHLKSKDLTMYPDQTPIYKAVSEFLNISQDKLLLTPGSDVAIKYIFETFVQNDDSVLTLWPTYAMTDVYTKMFGAKTIKINYDQKLNLNFDELLRVQQKARLVYIANPNQPTGTIFSENRIKQLLSNAEKNNAIVVIDEAYLPFSDEKSSINIIDNYPNLILIQTFSKAFGVASIRLGFIVSQPQNISWLNKVKPIHDINLFALTVGTYMLNNYHIVEDYVKDVKQSKIFIEKLLNKNGIDCIPSHANFIHLKFPKKYDTAILARKMKEKGYLVRSSGNGLPAVLEGCIRITVGPLEQMKLFVDQLLNIL